MTGIMTSVITRSGIKYKENVMSSLLEIMDKKSCGKWYAYEQSAFYLSRMMLELSLDRYVMENALWLARAEIDVNRISWDKVISHSQSEYVLHYRFHEWLVEIK